jgi:two-component system LytT family response regulator
MGAAAAVRALIVDDEPLACERIRNLLAEDPEMEVVGHADGHGALRAIRELAPDLLFLDVKMPGLDGFGVLKSLDSEASEAGEGGADAGRLPVVIFVTAFDRYALRAFEARALDYLVKPFDRERFEKAVQRAKAEIRNGRNGDQSRVAYARDFAYARQLFDLLGDLKPPANYLERLVVKENGRIFLIRPGEIDWIEAEGNYVRIHSGKTTHLLRETLSNLEARLHPAQFVRIHRSTIINIDRVQEMQPWFHGEYRVILPGGVQLTLTKNYKERLQEQLGISL